MFDERKYPNVRLISIKERLQFFILAIIINKTKPALVLQVWNKDLFISFYLSSAALYLLLLSLLTSLWRLPACG